MNNPRLPVVPARRTYKRRGKSSYTVKRLIRDWLEKAETVERHYDLGYEADKIRSKRDFFTALTTRKFGKDRCAKGEWLLLRCTAHSPYEGCWYEPNFWFLSPDLENIAPLYVSHGKWNAEERNAMCKGSFTFRDYLEQYIVGEYQDWWDEWELHIMKKETLITEFVHPKFVPSICANFEKHLITAGFNPPVFECSNCTRRSTEPHTHNGDYYGIGGLATATDRLYCEECMCSGCNACGHPIKDGEGLWVSEELAKRYDVSEGDYCEHCVPEIKCPSCELNKPVTVMFEDYCTPCATDILKKVHTLYPDGELPMRCDLCGGPRLPDSSTHPTRCQACVDKEMLPNKGA